MRRIHVAHGACTSRMISKNKSEGENCWTTLDCSHELCCLEKGGERTCQKWATTGQQCSQYWNVEDVHYHDHCPCFDMLDECHEGICMRHYEI
ncbi:hypothetical protein V5799_022366 [Amblyomma americanum]|uniref:Uncharacterized protein n=1 Tax=Amblyomma americanum TaxID=6943 RepID=A0AAQ4FMR6_AMBAM